jgi:hypothetical protein
VIALLLLLAAPQRLAILPATVEGPYGSVTAVQLFEEVAKSADFRVGIELVPYNALFVEGVEPIATTVRDCGSDVPCIARALRLARIDLGLRVIANFALEPPLITLNLIAEERVVAEDLAELDGPLAEVLARSTEKILRSYPRGGRLSVEVSPLDAAVTISPPPNGSVIAPGTVQVTAAKDGYLPRTTSVAIAEGTEQSVRLVLDPVPEEASVVESPWLWAGVGVGVAAIVTVVLVVTNPFSREPEEGIVCVTTPMGGC